MEEDANFPLMSLLRMLRRRLIGVLFVRLEAAIPDYPERQHGRHAHAVAELSSAKMRKMR